MQSKYQVAARRLLKHDWSQLTELERSVIKHFIDRARISRNTNQTFDDERTFGQRLADRIAAFGGSWTFIIIFCLFLAAWVILNSYVLLRYDESFDPYPYILLNLCLSMLAALQAPVIMMSQNRQAAKDRLDAAHDYEVNLKAELEITALHEKLDRLSDRFENEFLASQLEQIRLLKKLLK